MATIYEVYNSETLESMFCTQEALEQFFPELRAGTMEVVDEIDESDFFITNDNPELFKELSLLGSSL